MFGINYMSVLIAGLLLLIGIVLMSVSLVELFKIYSVLSLITEKERKVIEKSIKIQHMLIGLSLVGYIASIGLMFFRDHSHNNDILVGVIFC